MKRILSATVIILLSVGSAIGPTVMPAMPSATPTQLSLPSTLSVTTLAVAPTIPAVGSCPRPNGQWPYAYPAPSEETDFLSAPDPANDNQPYTGGIAYSLADNEYTYGFFIRNTGTHAIPIRAEDFITHSLDPLSGWPTDVQPGTQARLALRVHGGGNPRPFIEWHIAGQFGTVVVPYREPARPLLAPIQIGCG